MSPFDPCIKYSDPKKGFMSPHSKTEFNCMTVREALIWSTPHVATTHSCMEYVQELQYIQQMQHKYKKTYYKQMVMN